MGIINRVKTWWKISTPVEKVNTLLGIAGVAGAAICARKIDHAFDSMRIVFTLRGDEDLMNHVHGSYIRVETPDLKVEGPLSHDDPHPTDPDDVTPGEKQAEEEES